MPKTIDQRTIKTLVELLEDTSLTARERMDAARLIVELKATRVKRPVGRPKKLQTSVLG